MLPALAPNTTLPLQQDTNLNTVPNNNPNPPTKKKRTRK